MRSFTLFALAMAFSACNRPSNTSDAAASTSPPLVVGSSAPAASASAAVSTPHTPGAAPKLPRDLEAYDRADVVVAGTLVDPKITSVLEVSPPIYVHEFEIAVVDRLAGGSLPARVKVHFSSRKYPKPFPANTRMVVALERIEETLPKPSTRFEAKRIDVATPELEAKLASALSRAPDGLVLAVAQVQGAAGSPSPYGDGVFELTLRNDSGAPIEVPGVFAAGGAVQWAQAIEVRDESGRTLTLARSAMPAGATPLRLKPHEEVKTSVDVRPFGVVRPSGGERKPYSFAVGPIRTSSFFYYVHGYHGPMMGRP